MKVRTRFAPSPTGFMHIGNLRTALYTYLIARHFQGAFILRIEDTDQERLVEGAVEYIYRLMRLCGMDYDEGPDVGGNFGPYIQSERKDTYKKYGEQLISTGHAYRCFCTKERLDEARAVSQAKGETFKYDGFCKHLSQEEIEKKRAAGIPYVIRQAIPTEGSITSHCMVYGAIEVQNAILDEGILVKTDGLPTYNFANVVDDHLMEISHVVRGNEYLSSVAKYDHLYDALGWPRPVYIHLPPIMRDAQHKLSKRHGDANFDDFYSKGYLKEAIINYIALLGWSPGNDEEEFSLEDLKRRFTLEGIAKHPAIFDPVKLRWMNSVYIRKLPFEEFYALTRPHYESIAHLGEPALRRLSEVIQVRVEVFSEVPNMVRFLAELPEYATTSFVNKKQKSDKVSSLETLRVLAERFGSLSSWTHDAMKEVINAYCVERGMKPSAVFWPLRIALSGQESTPAGAIEIAEVLGREESFRRFDIAIAKLAAE